jgi:hypothetical protein
MPGMPFGEREGPGPEFVCEAQTRTNSKSKKPKRWPPENMTDEDLPGPGYILLSTQRNNINAVNMHLGACCPMYSSTKQIMYTK